MNKHELLEAVKELINDQCEKLTFTNKKPLEIIKEYEIDHQKLYNEVVKCKSHMRNKSVMFEILRKTAAHHLAERCYYKRDGNAAYNKFKRMAYNLPTVLEK